MNQSTSPPDYFRALIGLRTLRPLHAGVLGGDHILDRPIDREVHTGWPKVNSTALKGALREQSTASKKQRNALFGAEEYEIVDQAGNRRTSKVGREGLISLTDARLLLFPIRSVAGGWAWITCPRVLLRFRDEIALTGFEPDSQEVRDFYGSLSGNINEKAVYAGDRLAVGNHLLLQQHQLPIDRRLRPEWITAWHQQIPLLSQLPHLSERLVILSEENFTQATRLYTEISTRNKIQDHTQAAGGGALFTEEYLPDDALLYAMAFSMPNATHTKVMGMLNLPDRLQLAGNATLGKGRCALNWYVSPSLTSAEL